MDICNRVSYHSSLVIYVGDSTAESTHSNGDEVELQEEEDHMMDTSDVPVPVDNSELELEESNNASTSESNSRNDDTDMDSCSHIDRDVVLAVLRAFSLAEDMGASQKNLMEIVSFGRDLYCKGDIDKMNRWPKNYAACVQVLRNAGYRDPVPYHICLSETHPNRWSSMQDPMKCCTYCGEEGSIMYYYLRLSDKVSRWCSSEEFCIKMTAHWRDRATWLHHTTSLSDNNLNEIWHGSR